MSFNFYHLSIFAFVTMVLSLYSTRKLVEDEELKKHSLEGLAHYILISLIWIAYGYYKDVDSVLLVGEGFVSVYLAAGFIFKLNMNKSNTFLGKPVPGHGAPETETMKKIKYFIVYSIGFFLLIFVLFILYNIIFNY